MTIQVFGADATVSYLNRAFTDTSPANAIFKNQVARVEKIGDAFFANEFAASWSSVSNAALSKQVLTNFGVLPTTNPDIALLETALTDIFATNSTNRGIVVLNLANILADLESTATGAQAVYKDMAAAWNSEVTSAYTYSSNAANTNPTVPGAPTIGQTYTLTTASDTFTGTAGNDIFTATLSNSLSAFDALDGGAGSDTLNAALGGSTAITALPGGTNIKNIENISINVDVSSASNLNVDPSTFAGVTSFTLNNARGSVTLTNGGTTAINVASADDAVSITGGGAVTVSATGTKANAVTGSALTTVSAKGGAVAIDNQSTGAVSAVGTTMTAATVESIGADSTIKGAAVATVTWKNQTVAKNVTVTNGTSTAITLNVDGVGYDSTGTAVAAVKFIPGAAATSLTINATGSKSNPVIDGTAATGLKTITTTGSADLNLAATALPATVTKVDGSAATGAVKLNTTGLTALATVSTGAGADTVTLAAAAPSGTTISLGAGDDKLLNSGGSWTSSNPGAIDGGAGTDVVAVSLLNGLAAGPLAQFKNFEQIDLSGAGTVDVSLLTASTTITGLTLTTPSTGSGVTNLPAGAGLTVTNPVATATPPTAPSGAISIGLAAAATAGAADAFTVTFAGTDSAKASDAGVLTVNGIENFTVASGGSSAYNTLSLADGNLQTLTLTGAKDLYLVLAAGNGLAPTSTADSVNGLKLIDGSAATGKLSIDASTVTATNIANAGLTIKGGTGADTIVGTTKADVIIAGGGADVVTGGVGADKITLSGTTSSLKITGSSDTGSNNATITQTALLTAALDVVTGAAAGAKFLISDAATAANIGAALGTSATLATNLQGSDDKLVFARGTYDAANGIFSYGAAGPDTVMTYDGNTTAGTTDFHSVILVGYIPSTTTAATTAYASNVATITLA